MNRLTLIILLLFGSTIFLTWRMRQQPSKQATEQQLIVGTNAEYPPFSFIQDGQIVGFDIDIAKQVADRMGKELVLKDMPFEALLPKLQLGDFQMLAAGMTITPQRAKRVLFSKPYLSGDPLLVITPVARPLDDLASLHGKKVAVNEGYTADMYLAEQPEINLLRLATSTEAFLALQSGRVQAFVAAKSSVDPFFERHGSAQYHVKPLEGLTDNYALLISKKYPELVEPVQKALDAMEEDGTLAELKRRWKLNNDD